MQNQIKKHLQKMKELKEEIKKSTGYRKKDLTRQYNQMQKDLYECYMHLKGSDTNSKKK